ncbi:hypothetical protein RCL1_007129 [Eukaryota sp. TZLM3-RCL]
MSKFDKTTLKSQQAGPSKKQLRAQELTERDTIAQSRSQMATSDYQELRRETHQGAEDAVREDDNQKAHQKHIDQRRKGLH